MKLFSQGNRSESLALVDFGFNAVTLSKLHIVLNEVYKLRLIQFSAHVATRWQPTVPVADVRSIFRSERYPREQRRPQPFPYNQSRGLNGFAFLQPLPLLARCPASTLSVARRWKEFQSQRFLRSSTMQTTFILCHTHNTHPTIADIKAEISSNGIHHFASSAFFDMCFSGLDSHAVLAYPLIGLIYPLS